MRSYFSYCSSKVFWLKDVLMHPGLPRAWVEVQRVEEGAHCDVQKLVNQKLEALVRYAVRTVPFYREWCKEQGLNPQAVRFVDLPVLSKGDIRGREEAFVADGYSKKSLIWSRTSGSTGEPFGFYRAKRGASFDYTYATLWRGMARFGIRPGDKRVLVKGVDETPSLSLIGRVRRWVYEVLNRCCVVDAHFLAKSDENVEAELGRILRYRPDYFHGYVSSIYLLARFAQDHGVDVSGLKLKAIVTESEKCLPFQRECMERVFGAPVVENYGSVEFGMIAQPARDGVLCVNEDHVYVETTPDGEAVLTNLDERGFPFIRFKNGDLLKLGAVASGLPYRTLTEVSGRMTEMVKLPQGGALQGFIVMYPLYKHTQWIRAYQVYQPVIDRLIIRIVPMAEFPDAIRDQILNEMRTLVGTLVNVEIQFVSDIPLSKRGKRLFICSDVKSV